VLLVGNSTDFLSDFGEVLVLAKDESYIVLLTVGHADDVQCKADVYPLLLSCEEGVCRTVREFYSLIAVVPHLKCGQVA
jgi:hypothetical protein